MKERISQLHIENQSDYDNFIFEMDSWISELKQGNNKYLNVNGLKKELNLYHN